MIGFYPVGSKAIGIANVMPAGIGDVPDIGLSSSIIHPICSSAIAALNAETTYTVTDQAVILTGVRKRLNIEYTEDAVLSFGVYAVVPTNTHHITYPDGVIENHIPAVLVGARRQLMLRRTAGYITEVYIPLTLDIMYGNIEAAWLLRLYERAVHDIRANGLPAARAGTLEVSTPTLVAQAIAMREHDNSYLM